jgi:hypothetical protein
LIGRSAVLMCLKDASPCWDDVAWKAHNKGDIALLEGVFGQEIGEVGAGEDRDLLACTVEVGGNGILLVAFVLCNEDVAKRCGAGGRGDSEDDVRCWGQLLGGVAGGLLAETGF